MEQSSGLDSVIQLESRIDDLIGTFLPDPTPTGDYSVDEYDRISAFVLISHAEVESALEQMCEDTARELVEKWRGGMLPCSAIVSLIVYANPNEMSPPSSTADQPSSLQIAGFVDQAHKCYLRLVKQNNGLRPRQLGKLLRPLGIREQELDDALLAAMDTFGSVRGRQAHQQVGARQPLDPREAGRLVEDVLTKLRLLESQLLGLVSGASGSAQ